MPIIRSNAGEVHKCQGFILAKGRVGQFPKIYDFITARLILARGHIDQKWPERCNKCHRMKRPEIEVAGGRIGHGSKWPRRIDVKASKRESDRGTSGR